MGLIVESDISLNIDKLERDWSHRTSHNFILTKTEKGFDFKLKFCYEDVDFDDQGIVSDGRIYTSEGVLFIGDALMYGSLPYCLFDEVSNLLKEEIDEEYKTQYKYPTGTKRGFRLSADWNDILQTSLEDDIESGKWTFGFGGTEIEDESFGCKYILALDGNQFLPFFDKVEYHSDILVKYSLHDIPIVGGGDISLSGGLLTLRGYSGSYDTEPVILKKKVVESIADHLCDINESEAKRDCMYVGDYWNRYISNIIENQIP